MEIAFTVPAWLLWGAGLVVGGFVLGLAVFGLVMAQAMLGFRF